MFPELAVCLDTLGTNYYRFKQLYKKGGEEAFKAISLKNKPNFKNRIPEETEKLLIKYAIEHPTFGHLRVSNELRKQGILSYYTFCLEKERSRDYSETFEWNVPIEMERQIFTIQGE